MKRGQALMVVLLMLGVLATVGLSVMSRSRTEVSESTVQEESARALEAAEVGLEKYLGGSAPSAGVLTPVTAGSDAKFSLGAVNLGLNETYYTVPYQLSDGDVATLDLTGFTASGGSGVRVCWGQGNPTAGRYPAMVATIYYRVNPGTGWEYRVRSRGYDPESGGPRNGWENVTGGSNDCTSPNTYNYSVNLKFDTNVHANDELYIDNGEALFMRVRLMTNDRAYPVAFGARGPGVTFPLQAGSVESMGTSGDTIQRIKAVVPDYDMPVMFDSAIFSGSSLTK